MNYIHNLHIRLSEDPINPNKSGGFNLVSKDLVSFSKKGIFIGFNDTRREDIKFTTLDVKEELSSSEVEGKSLYRFPKLTLPRIKMDILKENNNIKITRDQSKADYHVVSTKYFESLSQYDWDKYMTVDTFIKEYFNDSVKGAFTQDACIAINNYIYDLDGDDFICLDIKSRWNGPWQATERLINEPFRTASIDKYLYFVKKEQEDQYKILMNSNKLVYDTALLNLCNSELHVITDDEVDSIETMLKSQDKETVTLALEMIANCNLDKCFDKVAYCFYFYHESMKYGENWNHINVKTIRKMMGDNFTPYHGNNNAYFYERFIKALVKHDSLTEWGLKKTVQRLVNKGLNSYGLNRDVFHVDADNIKLSDKYKQSLIKHETGEEILQEITMDPLDDLPF
jgi:hypothetical protein